MKVIIALFLMLLASYHSFGQDITEENYLRLDSALWMQYEQDMNEISDCYRKFPDKKDSLNKESKRILDIAGKKNEELALKFATVPSGLQRVFMVRLAIPKDTLKSVLANLPEEMRRSPYAKSIRYHIETEQIKEGDRYYDFEATTADGQPFTLSSLEGKNILLLYGGLGCMGKEGRDYLNKIYSLTPRDSFEIVVYCPNSNLDNLQKVREEYPSEYILVSDFLQDHTPVKILYGAQTTPTSFFINKQGIVVMKTEGLKQETVNWLLQEKNGLNVNMDN
ncbi:MAG: redoxin domain-containing protein [Dysgonamonadaceae bacterium]|jgi:peroxiredoxin|nr:redoxin domain-containing protein [Dysgonamonadaceae bacterium]